jgi:hypothetical protein
MPGGLIQAPPWVRGVFDHSWAPMKALAQQVRCLPYALWGYLLTRDGGFVVISPGESRYVPGPTEIRDRRMENVAFLSLEDLARNSERPLRTLGHLLDHYLGCSGEMEGDWLSAGGGVTFNWRQAGARLPRLFALGYGVDEVARSNVQNYFAQSLALYCRDRQRLNMADPQICKWFRSTLWNEGFWREWERMKEDSCLQQE